jgi:3-deoxy-manno-octulosonate cytidylyltransferase (CMP-KDO synthetase)
MQRSITGTTSTVGIIPARWASSRFPGKPLHLIAGKPLLQHVYERCCSCPALDAVIVATDDTRIAEAAEAFGATVTMTRADHVSGTDRVAEAAATLPEETRILNIQGDEPLVSPNLIEQLATSLHASGAGLVTAASQITDQAELSDPNVVKVVVDASGNALYFSRSPIPYQRHPEAGVGSLRHHGIYGFQRQALLRFVAAEPAPLERAEGLEQLRALHIGERIHVVLTRETATGIDTREQADRLEALLLSTT